jgi:hypothetical protein
MEPELTRERLRELLGNCLSRLEQLTDLNAAEFFIDRERRQACGLITVMRASDVDAVLRAWPRGAKLLEGDSPDLPWKPSDHGPN